MAPSLLYDSTIVRAHTPRVTAFVHPNADSGAVAFSRGEITALSGSSMRALLPAATISVGWEMKLQGQFCGLRCDMHCSIFSGWLEPIS